ncbi:hypothetical protein GZ77_11390 [Endozoicomonas montiporae]|uniref:Lipoprotein n=2 Tax=Endozoicomonas montiporae TaxID=1027273 RepID=A0A081N8U1_9GAMM|nr:hypothetical protein [Endozoicomonas montiporae]AMO55222.1 lipoprotein [Endozoicomonas montiporae CL-33]KEQ14864.1 hypothetical protein GZ77_11390 [Endozoicomonas montiporae]
MNCRGICLAGFVTLVTVTGCTHVNQEAFNQLDAGMSIEDVEGILGKPESCNDKLGRTECIWRDKDREIRVSYIDQKVVVFSSTGLQ